MLRTRAFAMVLVMLWALVAGATTAAAQPLNDRFEWREYLYLEDMASGSTVGATREPDEPFHWWVGEGGSVWFEWWVLDGGCYTIDTCGSDFDTVLAVYSAPIGGPFLLNKIASDDDSPTCTTGTRQSSVTVEVPSNIYYIAVAGFGKSDAGNYTLRITRCPRPANDDYDDAEPLDFNQSKVGTTLGAEKSWDEQWPNVPTFSPGAAVWFRRPITDADCMTVVTEAIGQPMEAFVFYDIPPYSRRGVNHLAKWSEYYGTGFNVVYRESKRFRVIAGYDYRIACIGQSRGGPFNIYMTGCEPNSLPATRGDANGDGKVNIADVTAIYNYIEQGTQSIPGRADADCNGTVDSADAMFILHYLRDRDEFIYYNGYFDCDGTQYFSSLLDPAKKYEGELLDRYEVAYLGTREWSRRIAADPVVVAESIPDYVPVGLYYVAGIQLTTRWGILAVWGVIAAFWLALGGLVAWQFRRDWSRRAPREHNLA
jgi:hypothetical protein